MHPFKTIDLASGYFGWSAVVNSLIPLDLDVRWCWIISFQARTCYLRLKCEVTSLARVWLRVLTTRMHSELENVRMSEFLCLRLAAHMNINTSLYSGPGLCPLCRAGCWEAGPGPSWGGGWPLGDQARSRGDPGSGVSPESGPGVITCAVHYSNPGGHHWPRKKSELQSDWVLTWKSAPDSPCVGVDWWREWWLVLWQ